MNSFYTGKIYKYDENHYINIEDGDRLYPHKEKTIVHTVHEWGNIFPLKEFSTLKEANKLVDFLNKNYKSISTLVKEFEALS